MPGRSFKTLLLGLALCGCARQAAEQGIRVEYVDKPVITEVKCVKKTDIPDRPAKLSTTGAPPNLEVALSFALAKVSEWTRYGNKTDLILKSCAE